MAPSTPAHAESIHTILPLLDVQLKLTETLENLLRDEHSALLRSDLAGLAELVAQKQATASSLERASVDLAQRTGSAPGSLMARLGHEAQARWQQLSAAADRLRRQNLDNGALLNERQNRLRWIAQRAGQDSAPGYAPGPLRGLAASFSGRSLAHA